MRDSRWLLIVGLLCLSVLTALPAWADIQIQSPKPDVHLSFDIHANGSNETRLEVAVHPFLDPLMKKGLDLLATQLAQLPDMPKPKLGTSKRDGREYSMLSVKLNSLGDLNALVNTPQMLSGLLGLVASDSQVPPLFTDFVIEHDVGLEKEPFRVKAYMSPETTQALSFLNLTVHVLLPYKPSEHNATQLRGNELSWQVRPGQALEMKAEAPTGPDGGVAPWSLLLGGLTLLGLIAVVVILVQRARQPKDETPEEPW